MLSMNLNQYPVHIPLYTLPFYARGNPSISQINPESYKQENTDVANLLDERADESYKFFIICLASNNYPFTSYIIQHIAQCKAK